MLRVRNSRILGFDIQSNIEAVIITYMLGLLIIIIVQYTPKPYSDY